MMGRRITIVAKNIYKKNLEIVSGAKDYSKKGA
jgi:hypothetical protein